jgi:class 3 adenylate cyclase
MKRLLAIAALFAPGAALLFFQLNPQADLKLAIPLQHFYIVTFTTFAAVVLSILLVALLGSVARARHLLAAAAFAVIGGIFFSHGLATPGALIAEVHPAVRWSAWLTFFGGGVLFVLASLDGAQTTPRWLPARRLAVGAVMAVGVYSLLAALAPQWLQTLEDQTDPWTRAAIFYISLALWIGAALRLWWVWRITRKRVDGVLVLVAAWLITATISLHNFPLWQLSWWIYHFILLIAFVTAGYVLLREYEQTRQFRLTPYYMASSLVLTALLALGASALLAQFVYNTLEAQWLATTRNTAQYVAMGLANDLSDVTTLEAFQKLPSRSGIKGVFARRLEGLSINGVIIYDQTAISIYASQPEWIGVKANDPAEIAEVMEAKQAAAAALPPATAPVAYGPSSQTYLIEGHAPFYPGGDAAQPALGVVTVYEEAPSLGQSLLQARFIGLVTAAVSMGLLFIGLLTVVRRAEGIITSRTDELHKVSAQLKTYSEWLLGKDLLERLLANPEALSLIRRERTVLFMDIRGFTAWSEDHTPEQVVDLLNRYYNATEGIMAQRGAIKFKFAADEAMAVFAEAATAVQAASELRERVGAVLSAHNLGAGIGLHTGQLVEGLLGSMEVKFYDVVGDTVNTAKRIESAAARAEVLLSETTRKAVRETVALGPTRAIAAKGKDEPVMVYPLQ